MIKALKQIREYFAEQVLGITDCSTTDEDSSYDLENTTNIQDKITEVKPGWNSIEKMPAISMSVQWICKNGVEDTGYFNHLHQEFLTYDARSTEEITFWKPVEYN